MSKSNQEAIERLRAVMPKGSTVYTILRHVSRSGMMRHISALTVNSTDSKDGGEPDIRQWDRLVSEALGWPLTPRCQVGIKVSGVGMDMGFHLVYSLAQVIHGDGYALKQQWL
jgi:hypothetical protein